MRIKLPEREIELKKLALLIKIKTEREDARPGTEKYKRIQESISIGFYSYRNFIIIENAEKDDLVIDPIVLFSIQRGDDLVKEIEDFFSKDKK